MDQKVVRKLEPDIEEAVAEVFSRLGARPAIPAVTTDDALSSQQTMHFMAKTAVTVTRIGW